MSSTVEMYERDGLPRLATQRIAGKGPGIVFLPGFRSDLTGTKAQFLFELAKSDGRAALLLDYRGHGASDGRFEDGAIGDWAKDAIDAITALTTGPQIVVGSSMGGWIACLVARALPDRVAGLVGIAPAPDFTERLMRPALTDAQRKALDTVGKFEVASIYDPVPTVYTRRLFEDGVHQLVLNTPLVVQGKVRLLHGLKDPDVPWQHSVDLAEHVTCDDARVVLVKDGDHRLSRPTDLGLLADAVAELTNGD
ncbi:alpha/beta hydrolase [Roseiterribacter gracilis]|uniref:Palmitoyl-protein thioesterase ABHD10, mitochondrial n=1 Tax=Roseiterribacter gracilis TaxID=2812848 RepID=A0A8S8XDJ1_9PROT|nr:alpha/beta hydrolase [Rhodospirillales bacterium TMPK1]